MNLNKKYPVDNNFEIFRGIKVKSFDEFVFENYQPLNETTYEEEVLARKKVHRNLLWILARKGFFGTLLSKVNIYGVSDPYFWEGGSKTMCTNGVSIIYHPDFVLSQSDAAIRFVLCHEILHCAFNHQTRRGTRNPLLWNIAADLAMNPILNQEVSSEFNWPVSEDGSRMGLFEESLAGQSAEFIYDKLMSDEEFRRKYINEGEIHVIDSDEDLPPPTIGEEGTVQEPNPPSEPGEEPEEEPEEGEAEYAEVGDIIGIKSGPNAGTYGIIVEVDPLTGKHKIEVLTREEASEILTQRYKELK